MSILLNFCKSTLLASLVFWLIIFTEHLEIEILIFIVISVIPVFVCCTITITLTIYPFFRWCDNNLDKEEVFKTYFPFYGIVHFSICIYIILMSNFEIYVVAFLAASFITTSQSWIWFTKNTSKSISSL